MKEVQFTYRADVTMSVDVVVQAASYEEAEELIDTYLAPISESSLVDIHSNDGIDIQNIESDDDPQEAA